MIIEEFAKILLAVLGAFLVVISAGSLGRKKNAETHAHPNLGFIKQTLEDIESRGTALFRGPNMLIVNEPEVFQLRLIAEEVLSAEAHSRIWSAFNNPRAAQVPESLDLQEHSIPIYGGRVKAELHSHSPSLKISALNNGVQATSSALLFWDWNIVAQAPTEDYLRVSISFWRGSECLESTEVPGLLFRIRARRRVTFLGLAKSILQEWKWLVGTFIAAAGVYVAYVTGS